MTIKVNFAGVGNAVEATIPVEIGSGMVAQSRRTGVRRRGTRRRSTVDPLPLYTEREEPPPAEERRRTLDLPPYVIRFVFFIKFLATNNCFRQILLGYRGLGN